MTMPEDSEAAILRPPECVRGMTKLDKESFSVDVEFPAVELGAKDVPRLAGCPAREFLIGSKLNSLKCFIDAEKTHRKLAIFHPDMVNCDESKQKVTEFISRVIEPENFTWTTLKRKLTFDNWGTKAIIKAVLPEDFDYSSYTQTGHIVHCNFGDHLLDYRFVLAEILLNKVKNCRTVVQKASNIENVYRNLNLELLAGVPEYVTEVKEEGCRYKLDYSKVYWNSRLSFEHNRLISKFDANSLVYDACAGIGPFVIPAWRRKRCRRIIANDLNPDSVSYLKVNLDLNKINAKSIEVHNVDAVQFISSIVVDDVFREFSHLSSIRPADAEAEAADDVKISKPSGVHVIMNLPAMATEFLPAFKGLLRRKAGRPSGAGVDDSKELPCPFNVYCYLFAKSSIDVENDWYEKEARRIVDAKVDWHVSLIRNMYNVRTVSSRKEMFCAEIELTSEYLNAPSTSSEEETCPASEGKCTSPSEGASLGGEEPPGKKIKLC